MSSIKWILNSAMLLGAVGAAVGFWLILDSGEERKKAIVKNLPEANPVRREETRRRNALVMQAIKEAAETDENVCRSTPWAK
ncbi:ubiquinol-cytochrome-c reductase complex assembly factor 3 [Latimeria chalumnae]|uniref:ubiquinol-cytochrome-c reductase complex assembly factor 3 n=1 Tax=Latimeria chalumnae TaxID=7897 RepID=UPI0003C16DFD|nr:PREDICTED: ubiquinol-cytochrome-c reductase complex assembly factor 3 [Latimeria chalumnae]|eukprot:XP_005988937.1 PREDICTED: ubiquinol-cytochrome-c reductase complex assembly factor 3 [Latimeria chalumnae]